MWKVSTRQLERALKRGATLTLTFTENPIRFPRHWEYHRLQIDNPRRTTLVLDGKTVTIIEGSPSFYETEELATDESGDSGTSICQGPDCLQLRLVESSESTNSLDTVYFE